MPSKLSIIHRNDFDNRQIVPYNIINATQSQTRLTPYPHRTHTEIIKQKNALRDTFKKDLEHTAKPRKGYYLGRDYERQILIVTLK